MKITHIPLLAVLAAGFLPLTGQAQVNSGSDGHDGTFNPTQDVTIDMADHPDGIYQFTSVNIPSGVTVTFKSNASNKPVVWLVQGNCTVSGTVSLNGQYGRDGGVGAPGGYSGGNKGGGGSSPSDGLGPGGGHASVTQLGGSASFATAGSVAPVVSSYYPFYGQATQGETYGSDFCIPLVGGSGGGGVGGNYGNSNGGGGAGAILIAAGDTVQINGQINAIGGSGGGQDQYQSSPWAGSGSGGAVRFVATHLRGGGSINVSGGTTMYSYSDGYYGHTAGSSGGSGRIRLDALDNSFSGSVTGQVTRGYQPIVIPPANVAASLTIQSVGGVVVPASPAGQLVTPDVIVPANQQNPIPIVVRCANIPLNTEIIVDVKPANGAAVRAVGLNTSGTQSSSTATVQVTMPRGGGMIQAKAVSGLALASASNASDKVRSLAETGWTADGERFAQVEVTATLGSAPQIAFLTESGKRYTLPIP